MSPAPDDTMGSPSTPKVDLALCVDPASLRRFRAVLRHLCVGLLDVAAQVRLVTSSPEAESLMLGSVQHVFYREVPWPLRRQRLRQVFEELAGRVPNLVHGVSARSLALTTAIARHFDAYWILHALSLDDAEALFQPGDRLPDRVVAVSPVILDALLERGDVARERVSLVRPGIIAADEPACFGRPHQLPTILCTSRLNPGHGADRLLEALRMLRARGHRFMAFLTGSGSLEASLRKTAHADGLASMVTFAKPLGEATQIMAGADVFVRPAIEAEFSVRTLQAMGAGLAVVTVLGGVSDAQIHEVTGLVCPDSHPTTLAAGLERMLLDRPFARDLAANAVQYVKQHHSVSAMCEALMQIYYELSLRDKTLSLRSRAKIT